MEYSEVIAYFHSLTDYEKTRIERYAPETLNLDRVQRLLSALGDPHKSFRSIHVAGTKGKGSTAAIAGSCLRAGGYRIEISVTDVNCGRKDVRYVEFQVPAVHK